MKRKECVLLSLVVLSSIYTLGGCGERNTVTNYQEIPENVTSITFFWK